MAHSIEIRERAVAAYRNGSGTLSYICGLFQTSQASLKRWARRLRETGTVAAKPHGGGKKILIDQGDLSLLKRWVTNKSDMTLEELQECYNKRHGTSVSRATIGRAVRERLKLPQKKRPTARHSRTESKRNF